MSTRDEIKALILTDLAKKPDGSWWSKRDFNKKSTQTKAIIQELEDAQLVSRHFMTGFVGIKITDKGKATV